MWDKCSPNLNSELFYGRGLYQKVGDGISYIDQFLQWPFFMAPKLGTSWSKFNILAMTYGHYDRLYYTRQPLRLISCDTPSRAFNLLWWRCCIGLISGTIFGRRFLDSRPLPGLSAKANHFFSMSVIIPIRIRFIIYHTEQFKPGLVTTCF